MKYLIGCLCLTILAAAPALAQDEGGGGGGMDVQLVPVGPDNIKAIKETFAKAKITLTRDQENALKPMIDETVKAMEELNAGMRGGAGRGRGEGREGRGGRGGNREGGPGMRGPEAMNPAINARLRELNEQFETKMKTVLKPDQVAAWDAYRKEEIKRAGGIDALKVILADANAPLTPEQETQIAPLYQELFRNKAMLARQSQGAAPDAARLKELDSGNALQVMKFLNANQKKALLDALKPPAK